MLCPEIALCQAHWGSYQPRNVASSDTRHSAQRSQPDPEKRMPGNRISNGLNLSQSTDYSVEYYKMLVPSSNIYLVA